jgi:hypothetical protein
MPAPEIRANWSRMVLDYYTRALPPDVRDAVLAKLRAGPIARIAAAGPLEWLPAEHHVALVEAPFERVGRVAYRAMWRDMTAESLDRPIFRSLVQGTLALFRRSPAQLFRVVPQGWGLVARDTGEMVVEADGKQPRVEFVWRRMAPVLRSTDVFATAFAGSLDAVTSVAASRGSVDMDTREIANGVVRYRIAW